MPLAIESRPTILVVDNEPAILNLVKLILETAGYPVLAACNSQVALALFKDSLHSIDLLLTDINMPDLSGLELACQATETVPHALTCDVYDRLPPGQPAHRVSEERRPF